MSGTITTTADTSIPALMEDATRYAHAGKSDNTKTAYRTDWAQFCTWCEHKKLPALPASPSTVALYMVARANSGSKSSSLRRYLSSISQAHKIAGHESPCSSAKVREVVRGIERTHGTSQTHKKPLTADMLRDMVRTLEPGVPCGPRDKAILLLGFIGALRRSELVALDATDIQMTDEGMTVTIRRSKTDQVARGRTIGVPFSKDPTMCPVRAVAALLRVRPSGPLFTNSTGRRITGKTAYRVIKRLCSKIGADPSDFSTHSLRAGFATAAAKQGKQERDIMRQTGHKSTQVLRRYIDDGTLFTDNPAEGLL